MNGLTEVTWLLLMGVIATHVLGNQAPNWQQKIIALVFTLVLLAPLLPSLHINIDYDQNTSQTIYETEQYTAIPQINDDNSLLHQPVPMEAKELRLKWQFSDVFGLIWIIGVILAISKQLIQILRLQAIKNRSEIQQFDAGSLKIHVSNEAEFPMLMAWGHSCILLPYSITHWPKEAQQQVIDHEKCHYLRKDHWLLWLAIVVRIVYWFHPLVHWLFKRNKIVTELACDQDLMTQGNDRIHYVQAILASVHPNAEQVFNGMHSHPKQIKQRIQALIKSPKQKPAPKQRLGLIFIACGLLLGCVDWQINEWVPAQQLIMSVNKNLPSIRQHNPPLGEVHVAVFYDGLDYGQTHIKLKITNDNKQSWLSLGPLQKFNQYIHTYHIKLSPNTQFSGEYEILGVEADGMVDGVAVGMIFTDQQGRLKAWQSHDSIAGATPNFICSWPLGLYDEEFIAALPQLTEDNPDSVRRLLCGAQLVGNGLHQLN
ncbi:MAG: M56 family metallopeptidase [Marinicella sp.]